MTQVILTVSEAAEKAGCSVERVYQLAIQNKLKLGVNARGWWGNWCPQPQEAETILDTTSGVCDIDQHGIRTFSHHMSDGSVLKTQECYISQFWYVHRSELYELLTSANRNPRRVCWYEPIDPQKLVIEESLSFTSNGFFWVHKHHKGQQQDTTIGLHDLRVNYSDLVSITSPTDRLPSYLDPQNEHYSEEIAIAIEAHKAIFQKNEGNKFQSPGSQVVSWLSKNYPDRGEQFYKRIKTVVLPKKSQK